MEIGNMETFMAQQAGKVKRRQDEMKKIAKGVYQTQVMMDAKAMEDFEKECKKAEKAKTTVENTQEEKKATDYRSLFEEKKKELFTKIQNGDTEASFQIGADSFTLKGWNEFLSRFDSAQDTVEEMQEALKEQKEQQ